MLESIHLGKQVFLLKSYLRERNLHFSKWEEKILPPQKKFNLTMISITKILEFYHTLRKTWKLDVWGGIGPIKIRPYFDMPNPTLNIKIPSFPQSMIKFKYFWLRNQSQIKNSSRDKNFWPLFIFAYFCPFLGSDGSKKGWIQIF